MGAGPIPEGDKRNISWGATLNGNTGSAGDFCHINPNENRFLLSFVV